MVLDCYCIERGCYHTVVYLIPHFCSRFMYVHVVLWGFFLGSNVGCCAGSKYIFCSSLCNIWHSGLWCGSFVYYTFLLFLAAYLLQYKNTIFQYMYILMLMYICRMCNIYISICM